MTLRDFLAGELIDIIEWVDDADDTMTWRFSRPRDEIKNGAQLIVRPAQVAILVDEGRIADVFQPGRYELTTGNMPLLSSLRGWKYGFESPFKADVLFLSTKQFVGRKWGTANPVILRDAELGPVRLRAYGTYAVRIVDARKFVQEISGANSEFQLDAIADQLRDLVVSSMSGVLADSRASVYDLSSRYTELAARAEEHVGGRCRAYGLAISQVVVENISLPSEVEATIDQKTRMSMLGGDLDTYARMQSADAIRDAARNPGGGASAGVGIGIGAAVAQKIMQPLTTTSVEPPPLPVVTWYYAVGSERRGPVDDAMLRQPGILTAETLVWRAGFAAWTPAGRVPELAPLFAART
jgi:membrane protease subunit (stomatin/prohibitin family)